MERPESLQREKPKKQGENGEEKILPCVILKGGVAHEGTDEG